MNSFLASDQLFSESSAIKNVSIDDKLLKQFSTNVRKLAKTLQDWIELSTDWDTAIGRLRRADWQLRNDPAPLNLSHPAIVDLSEGIGILEGLFKNMSSEIQQTCTSIVASGQKILEYKTSELTNILLNKLNEADGNSIGNILVVRQESIRINVSNWIMEKGINQWKVFTANQFIHSDMLSLIHI